jgi:hypothetical protein
MSGAAGGFLRARLAALYLLSLTSCVAALAAWRPGWIDGPVRPWIAAGVLAAAALAGQASHDKLSLLADRLGRGRFRSAGASAHGAVVALGLLGLFVRSPQASESAVRGLVVFQPLFLLLAGLGRSHQGTLLNAAALTLFAALAGGPLAAGAVIACATLTLVFLAADHHARLLTEYPVAEAPGPGLLWREAIPAAAALGGLLALFFAAVPPKPFAAFVPVMPAASMPPELLTRLLLQLLGLAFFAGLLFYLLLRVSGRLGEGAAEPEHEQAVARRRAEPAPAAAAAPPEPPVTGVRAQVIRLYLKVLEQLARRGRPRRPHQTPAEFARGLEPAVEAGALTGLFVRARYGRDEMSDDDLRRADEAARAVLEEKPPA